MPDGQPFPHYRFRHDPPSLLDMLRTGVSDVASVIPEAILHEPAVQLPGPGAPLVVSDPELVRLVLADKAELFERDRLMQRLFRRAWGKGLAAAEGEDWQRQRKAATPAFTPKAIAAALDRIALAASEESARWPHETAIGLPSHLARIVARVVFTVLVAEAERVDPDAIAAEIPAYLAAIGQFGNLDLLPLPEALHDWLRGIPGDPAVQRIRAVAHSIAERRANDGSQGDLVALLDGVGPIEDNIRGLFPAAMDTTVTGTAWALYALALRPEWQARVAAEARACGGEPSLAKLPVTRRVVQEALRLFPAAPFLVRSTAVAHDLGGFPLAKGQPVSIALYAMHRHRKHWDRPDHFNPDRFLPERGHHAGFLPFGTGPRMCIAAQFALAEIAAIVATLAARFAFQPIGPAPTISLQFSTHALDGPSVLIRPRLP